MVTYAYYKEYLEPSNRAKFHKYSNSANDLLRESAFCMVPAAPIANYLDVDNNTQPSVTVSRMGEWSVIVEGANTYSPDPVRKIARARLEREVYRQRGVLIATDYLVNSGGVIFAAQERLIKTPDHLRIPETCLGDRQAVEIWLKENQAELAELADRRREAAETARDEVIRRNMEELVEYLVGDADMLPNEAAERISIQRIASNERDRRAAELMIPIPTIQLGKTVRQAAGQLVEAGSPILAVVNQFGELSGVVTDWDITRAAALGISEDQGLEEILTKNVVSVSPQDSILDVIGKLETHEISAMPVVDNGAVQGMITADLLARRSLLRLLQTVAD